MMSAEKESSLISEEAQVIIFVIFFFVQGILNKDYKRHMFNSLEKHTMESHSQMN